jgi:tetratricopeptide (TPR) repeat protein
MAPESATAYSGRGGVYAKKGQFDQAIADYTKAIELQPGETLFLRDGWAAKLPSEQVEEMVFLSAGSAYWMRGTAFEQKGELDQAIADYTKAIDIDPEEPVQDLAAYYSRGLAYAKKAQYVQAIADYSTALELLPGANVYYSRGLAYGKTGQYEQAITDYSKAIELLPGYTFAYYSRGHAYGERGQSEQAIADYTKAIELNPNFALAYSERGIAYLVELGDDAKGCADWRKACELGECAEITALATQKGCP